MEAAKGVFPTSLFHKSALFGLCFAGECGIPPRIGVRGDVLSREYLCLESMPNSEWVKGSGYAETT